MMLCIACGAYTKNVLVGPVAPVSLVGPCGRVGPCGPVAPREPFGPHGPVALLVPVNPYRLEALEAVVLLPLYRL